MVYQNKLLASLAADDIEYLAPRLTPVQLHLEEVLITAGQPVERYILLEEGLVLTLKTMANGERAIVSYVATMVGITALSPPDEHPFDQIVAIPGRGFAIRRDELRAAFERSEDLSHKLARVRRTKIQQVGQLCACNTLHSVREIVARHLLTLRDFAGGANQFPIKHAQVAAHLGIAPHTLSHALSEFRARGALLADGRILIRFGDISQLEAEACECYEVLKRLREDYP